MDMGISFDTLNFPRHGFMIFVPASGVAVPPTLATATNKTMVIIYFVFFRWNYEEYCK